MSRPCAHPNCPKQAYSSVTKKTGKVRHYTLCNTHRNEHEKARDLARWSFRKHKANAKRRGIFWGLTLEQFRRWATETEVLLGAGRSTHSLHVDRIIEALGYVEGNIQVLTNTQNITKENLRRKVVKWVEPTSEYETGGLKTVDCTLTPDEDCPF